MHPGLQEYVEAATFLGYNQEGGLVSIDELNRELQFPDNVRMNPPLFLLEYCCCLFSLLGKLLLPPLSSSPGRTVLI